MVHGTITAVSIKNVLQTFGQARTFADSKKPVCRSHKKQAINMNLVIHERIETGEKLPVAPVRKV